MPHPRWAGAGVSDQSKRGTNPILSHRACLQGQAGSRDPGASRSMRQGPGRTPGKCVSESGQGGPETRPCPGDSQSSRREDSEKRKAWALSKLGSRGARTECNSALPPREAVACKLLPCHAVLGTGAGASGNGGEAMPSVFSSPKIQRTSRPPELSHGQGLAEVGLHCTCASGRVELQRMQ